MSVKLGNTTIAGVSRETKLNAHSLLDFKWTDHLLNEMSWLRADTFSWQSGDVYTSVYNLLVAEYQNGTEETEGSIIFKRSANGYKITTDESGVSALFNETGVAWYYILDTENRRFKLPRSKYNAYTSQIAVRGNGMTLGLTDMVNNYGLTAQNTYYTTGALVDTKSIYGNDISSSGGSNGEINQYSILGITKDPTKSGIVADLSTQELHLYFYVGEFSQTATEQTAGITAELFNNKADKSEVWTPSSSTSAQKETVVGWGIPNYKASYTLGAFPFTAPKKCLFTGYVNTVGVYADLYANINGVNIKVTNTNAYAHSSFYFVLDKGDVITFANYVTASNCTIIPLKGAN